MYNQIQPRQGLTWGITSSEQVTLLRISKQKPAQLGRVMPGLPGAKASRHFCGDLSKASVGQPARINLVRALIPTPLPTAPTQAARFLCLHLLLFWANLYWARVPSLRNTAGRIAGRVPQGAYVLAEETGRGKKQAKEQRNRIICCKVDSKTLCSWVVGAGVSPPLSPSLGCWGQGPSAPDLGGSRGGRDGGSHHVTAEEGYCGSETPFIINKWRIWLLIDGAVKRVLIPTSRYIFFELLRFLHLI